MTDIKTNKRLAASSVGSATKRSRVEAKAKSKSKQTKSSSSPPIPLSITNIQPVRFDIKTNMKEGLAHLYEHGYVVWKDIVPKAEIPEHIARFWDYIESACPGVLRNDPKTWTNERWPGVLSMFILRYYGIGQSDFMWRIRTLPLIREFYTAYYSAHLLGQKVDDDDGEKKQEEQKKELVTSFCGCSVLRGAEHKQQFMKSWLHVDRNLSVTPDYMGSIQSSVQLLKGHPKTHGGFVCIPKSHHLYNELASSSNQALRLYPSSDAPHYGITFP